MHAGARGSWCRGSAGCARSRRRTGIEPVDQVPEVGDPAGLELHRRDCGGGPTHEGRDQSIRHGSGGHDPLDVGGDVNDVGVPLRRVAQLPAVHGHALTLANEDRFSPESGDAASANRERLGADAGSSPVNDAPTQPASAPAPKPAGSQHSEDRAAQEPKHRHRALVLVPRRARVDRAGRLDDRELGSDPGPRQRPSSPTAPNRSSRTRTSRSSSASSRSTSSTPTSTSRPRSQQKLPPPAQPLAAPVTAATRQLATNVAETALASPQVQQLVATAINGAQQRFVDLIENKGQFVSTQGGVVTLEYGSFVADLATRLGVDPAAISQIQGFIQQYSTELKQRLTTIQSKIESTRATLSQAQAGTLSPQVQQNLTTLETDAAAAPDDRREPPTEDRGHPAEGPCAAPEPVVRPPGSPGQARQSGWPQCRHRRPW